MVETSFSKDIARINELPDMITKCKLGSLPMVHKCQEDSNIYIYVCIIIYLAGPGLPLFFPVVIELY